MTIAVSVGDSITVTGAAPAGASFSAAAPAGPSFSVSSVGPSAAAATDSLGAVIAPAQYTDIGDNRAYIAHVFNSSGTLTVAREIEAQYLVVAGGGGGFVGGGGAGGLLTGSFTLPPGEYTVAVGAGGLNANGSNSKIESSTASLVEAIGGGFLFDDPNGGSGSGGGLGISPGAGTAGQGNNGGNGAGFGIFERPGGGGGAGGVGGNGVSFGLGGDGGAAAFSTFATGVSLAYAAGGPGTDSAGGNAGSTVTGVTRTDDNAPPNRGGGGVYLYAGGSGIVIIRYLRSA
jgi:hypothetical protein